MNLLVCQAWNSKRGLENKPLTHSSFVCSALAPRICKPRRLTCCSKNADFDLGVRVGHRSWSSRDAQGEMGQSSRSTESSETDFWDRVQVT